MLIHEKINYIEFPAKDLNITKAFFSKVFGWSFTDFGPDYSAFTDAGISGGVYQVNLCATIDNGSALIVFYSERLDETRAKITEAGGKISKPIFSFPGGKRFHFTEPSGNEFAVWSDQDL